VLFSASAVQSDSDTLAGVKVVDIVADSTPFRTVYDPGHPDADKEGYVSMPNINIIEEMVNMMMASRAYEASVSAFNMSKTMFLKTLELGRQ
jgi:flagellar basal-body rod protein FlgC